MGAAPPNPRERLSPLRFAPRSSTLCCVAFVLACSSNGDDSSQTDSGGDDVTASDAAADSGYAAAHTPMPMVVAGAGTPMTSPKLVAISFQADPLQGDIDAFADQMVAATEYWNGAVAEYGVGALTAVKYHAAETAAMNLGDNDVQDWIKNKIQTDSMFPQPDANTMYVLFYPDGTTVASGLGTTCNQFQGYHDSFPISTSANVTYAIVPRCAPPPVMGVTVTDQMTAEASHEIIEAATDPTPAQKATYITVDSDSHAWEILAGGEIGDLCAAFPDAFYKPTGVTHLVQHVWSNAAAAASHDPCEPDGAMPYFNSAPVLSDTITVAVGGKSVKTKGVKLSVGASTTVELDLYSDAPTSGAWKVSVIDITSAFFGQAPALQMSLDTSTGQNGDKINMTIKLLRNVSGGAAFWIQNDLGGVTTVWLGAVNPT